MISAPVKPVATKKPRVVFYLDDQLKSDLELLAEVENRSVSNLIETVAKNLVDEARESGKIKPRQGATA